jgi:hypothetical protein
MLIKIESPRRDTIPANRPGIVYTQRSTEYARIMQRPMPVVIRGGAR